MKTDIGLEIDREVFLYNDRTGMKLHQFFYRAICGSKSEDFVQMSFLKNGTFLSLKTFKKIGGNRWRLVS